MTVENENFRAFERAGWADAQLVAHYHERLSIVTRQCIDPLLSACGVMRGTHLLDVATGGGYVAGAAAAMGAVCTGVDFSASQIALARREYPQVEFHVADVEQLPFPAEQFDCAVCAFGMLHFAEPARALNEMFRVLKRNGRIAFAVWDTPERAIGFGALYTAIREHGSVDVGLPPGPNTFLFSDPEECSRILQSSGFVSPVIRSVPQVWSLNEPDGVFETMLKGTVRACAALRAQTPAALERIKQALREVVETYHQGERYVVPMPAVLAVATKPG